MGARQDVSEFWDTELRRWCLGIREPSPDLLPWLRSYSGTGVGAVDLHAFPEPWIGNLMDSPKVVMLGLNPGAASQQFQGEDGLFTKQVAASSFTKWAASSPYTSPAWEQIQGRNKYHQDRLSFARRFSRDSNLAPPDLLLMELFPFHSTRVTAPMRPPSAVLNPFVFEPLSELDVEFVFAFGKPWLSALEAVGFSAADHLNINWSTPSRAAVPFRLPSGQTVIVLTQLGYAGPPGAMDTAALSKELLDRASALSQPPLAHAAPSSVTVIAPARP